MTFLRESIEKALKSVQGVLLIISEKKKFTKPILQCVLCESTELAFDVGGALKAKDAIRARLGIRILGGIQ